MLTEQDFLEIIEKHTHDYANSDGSLEYWTDTDKSAKDVHSQHIAETERLMELAWSEGEKSATGKCMFCYPDNPPTHFKTLQDFKDSLNKQEV